MQQRPTFNSYCPTRRNGAANRQICRHSHAFRRWDLRFPCEQNKNLAWPDRPAGKARVDKAESRAIGLAGGKSGFRVEGTRSERSVLWWEA
jgi:hypothetical protein